MMANILVNLLYLYLIAGLIFGLWFIFKGAQKIDDGMNDVKFGTRLLLLPGSIGLWPLMLNKVLKNK